MHLERKLFVTSVILFLLIIGASMVIDRGGDSATDTSHDTISITLGSSKISAEVVDDEVSRSQGLSGRERLDSGTGMLFVFDTENIWGIWMNDMKLSIDVLWLDKAGKIITVEENMSPETYPKIFFPTKRSLYVLEIPAGAFRASGAKIDSYIDLSSLTTRP